MPQLDRSVLRRSQYHTHTSHFVGACAVHWRDGVRNTLERRFPDVFAAR